jgi:hypothetical protein
MRLRLQRILRSPWRGGGICRTRRRCVRRPTPRQKLEALDAQRSLDDPDSPWPAMGERADELIAAVNPVGKDMAQLGEPASQSLQKRYRSMAILNVGGMNVDGEQKAIGVGDDMPLAPVGTFAGIVASGAAGLGRRCTLTVEDRCRRPGLTPEFPAGLPNQRGDDFLPPSRVASGVKIGLDRRVRRKLLRQGTPLAARGTECKESPAKPCANPLPAAGPLGVAAEVGARSAPIPHQSCRLRSPLR